MTTPLSQIAPGRLRRIGVPALIVYLLALVPFALVGEPNEMIRLQLAGSESRAQEIVAGWSHAETVDMAYLQGVDELHPLAYGLLLVIAAVWAGRQLRRAAARWAPVIAWMAVAAAVFDLLENVGMVVMIRGDVDAPWPTITTAFAIAKFVLFVPVLAYAAAGVVARVRAGSG
ncbi:MAG TPA: hypothetical protein VIG64_00265 [Actinomycetota bacterium]|jgi:hypothetical protein